jgi:ABC-2 type transport system ATP-binding protein
MTDHWPKSSARHLERLGYPCEIRGPQAILRIDRARIADVLPEILRGNGVRDISVEDVPLEQIVAELFRSAPSRPALTAPAAAEVAS